MRFSFTIVSFLLLPFTAVWAQEPYDIGRLGWLAGMWRAEDDAARSVTISVEPQGGSFATVFQGFNKETGDVNYNFAITRQVGDAIIARGQDFGADFEPRGPVIEDRVTRLTDREIVFTCTKNCNFESELRLLSPTRMQVTWRSLEDKNAAPQVFLFQKQGE